MDVGYLAWVPEASDAVDFMRCAQQHMAKARIGFDKRCSIDRMLRIHAALKAGAYPNCLNLARQLECGEKTIWRDVEFMRDRLALPIEFSHRRNGYFYRTDRRRV